MNIKSVAVALVTLIASSAAQAQEEPMQWRVEDGGNGHWYQRFAEPLLWSEARERCELIGGHLATIATEGENSFVYSINQGQLSFLGGFQVPKTCEPLCDWQWVTGEQWNWTNWSGDEPNDGGGNGQDQLAMYPSGYWDDYWFEALGHLCEWSADCNNDGVVDYGQILQGQLADSNGDNIPDVCQCPSTIRVPEDAPSINAAVAQVCAGTTAEIVVGSGSWTAHVTPAAGASIVVRGTDRATTIILPGGSNGRFTTVPYGSAVRFVDATLRNGGPGLSEFFVSFERCDVVQCAGNFFPESASVIDSQFIDCPSSNAYGILYLQPDTTVARCSFIRCTRPLMVWGDGGGNGHLIQDCTFQACNNAHITVYSSCCSYGANRARIERCTFDDTTGGSGAAIQFDAFQAAGAQTPVLDIVDCVFRGIGQGTSNSAGGAVRIGGGNDTGPMSSTTITGSSFIGCRAGTGGAIYVRKNEPVVLSGCTFTDNSATAGPGGALAQEFGGYSQQLMASNCSFVGNTASSGGGALKISGWSGAATLTNCNFQSNVSQGGYGGAVNVDRTQITLSNCQFTGNRASAPLSQGGAYHQTMGSAVMNQCGFADNWADGDGGAVEFYSDCTAEVSGCTFSDNAAQFGGAIMVAGSNSSCLIHDSAFRRNLGSNINSVGKQTQTTVSSSIVCGATGPAFSGSVTDAGGNCVATSCADADNNGLPDECQAKTVPGDYDTIQDAINAASTSEICYINVAPGTYAGPINLSGKPIRLIGTGGAAVTTISGTAGQSQSVIRAISGEPAISLIKGFTISGGSTGTPLPSLPSASCGGGLLVFNAQTSIEDCMFIANEATFGGGAYFLGHSGSITNCTFSSNIAQAYGGGLQLFACFSTVTSCTFTNNLAVNAGGGMHTVNGQPKLVNCSFGANFSYEQGGGVSWDPVADGSLLTLTNCTVSGNTAEYFGGGFYIYPSGVASETQLVSTTICGNSPRNVSGAYQADSASQVCDCRADLNDDSVVNGIDLAIIVSNWATASATADINGDGTVNGADLTIVLVSWGSCTSN